MAKYANRTVKPSPTRIQRSEAKPSLTFRTAEGSTPESRMREQLQRMVDEKELGSEFGDAPLQMKLKVAPAGDPAEAEADNAAREIVQGAKTPAVAVTSGGPSLAQRISRRPSEVQRVADEEIQEKSDEEIQERPLQRVAESDGGDLPEEDAQLMADEDAQLKADEDAQLMADEDAQLTADEDAQLKRAPRNHQDGFTADHSTHTKLQQRKGMGQPLPDPIKSEMEAGFGTDLSDVRIHRDQSAAQLNQEVAAKAFTTGNEVFFGADQYDDQSAQGKELIAHELTHTIQQGAIKPNRKPNPGSDSGSNPDPQTPTETREAATKKASPKPKKKAAPPASAKGKKGKSKRKGGGKSGAPSANLSQSPTDPKDDPAFKQQIAHVKQTADQQQTHPQPGDKVTEIEGAAMLPESDQEFARDGGSHLNEMDADAPKEREPISAEGFKKILAQNLDDLEKELPNTEDEAKEFKDKKPIQGIKENIAGQVKAENAAISGPLAKTAGQKDPPQNPKAGTITTETPLKAQDPGKAPQNINAQAAVPKPKYDHEISMEEESEDLDAVMEQNDVTEAQLANSNEPKFTGALETKHQAQSEAAAAPQRYRKQENSLLKKARNYAQKHGKDKLIAMYGSRAKVLLDIFGGQTKTEKKEETQQQKIHRQFEENYNATKEAVTTKLDQLSENVDKYFEYEAEAAKKTFEKNVEKQIDAIYGWTVIDDWLFGADTEAIEAVFIREKARFIRKMNEILDKIAHHIATELKATLDLIHDGQKKNEQLYAGLTEEEKKLAQESYESFKDQYADLEDAVYDKQDELAADLAKSYKENVDSLRESFEKIRDEIAAGWIGKAFQALMWVINKIIEIYQMLFELLAAVVEAIGSIISDPIGFLSNLINGISEGFNNFIANIKKHIVTGLIEWLTGSLGGVGITLPDNIFSLSGVFNLVLQILGLTWDYFRNRAVKMLGEKVVAAMEYGFELFQKIRTGGLQALWDEIKEKFQDLQTVVMDAIRDMVITKVIEAGIKWIMGLLNPAGAFIKAAMLIVDIARFFIERAAQIFELVRAFTDGIRAIARGDVGGVAKAIEKALAKAIPVLISFLAALVGVTGLTKKVQKIVKKIRRRINKAIDKVIKKARKIFKRGGKGTKKSAKDKKKKKDDKKHRKIGLAVKKKLRKPVKKKDLTFEQFYAIKTKEAKALEKKYQKKLEKGIKLKITFGGVGQEKKDDDIDFKISIKPNDYVDDEQVKHVESSKLYQLDRKGKTASRGIKQVFQAKMGTLTPANDPKPPQNYLAQVIGAPDKGGKLYQLPKRYVTEAWGDQAAASRRFSLVMGVNLFDDFEGNNEKTLKTKVKSQFSNPGYPLGIVTMLWTPNWRIAQKGNTKQNQKKIITVPQLRKEVDKIKDPQKKTDAIKDIKLKEKIILAEKGKYVPYGKLRDRVNNHAYTAQFSKALKGNTASGDVYVHLGDADSANLNVNTQGGIDPKKIVENTDTPLFKAYDAIIDNYQKKHETGGKPYLASGGYRFDITQYPGEAVPDHLRIIANQMDQEYRQAMAKLDPQMVYWAEPNTILKLEGNKLAGSFGGSAGEGKKMVESLIKQNAKYGTEVAYESAPITTDGERFYAKEGNTVVSGEVFASVGGGGQNTITLEQFRSLFYASQQSVSRNAIGRELSGHREFADLSKAQRRQLKGIIGSMYDHFFPHTNLLGAEMNAAGAWPSFPGNLAKFDPGKQELTDREQSKLIEIFGDSTGPEVELIIKRLQSGSESVKSYLTKLFTDIKPA
ncbi:MAG: DUF4157 domain-containing protein [Bacteroidota bacterium]